MLEPAIDRSTAAAHEALYVRLERLARQVDALALRKPGAAVPAETLALAQALVKEVARFSPKARLEHHSIRAQDLAGLVTGLGQALARLDLFESAHSSWSGEHNCFVWRLRREEIAPVARLRQKAIGLTKTASEKRQDEHIRRGLTRLINAKVSDAYEAGYADSQMVCCRARQPLGPTRENREKGGV